LYPHRLMRLALAVLAVVVVVPVHDGAARTNRKRGKVVRVERGRADRVGQPRFCQIRPDGSATCFGKVPEVGQIGTVMDDVSRKATVRITQVTPSIDSCGNVTGSEILSEATTGDLSQNTGYNWTVLFDYKGTANTHSMYQNGQIPTPGNRGPGVESVWMAFDDDQDANADFIITYYSCDDTGAVSMQGGPGYCMVYYAKDASSFIEQRVDIVRGC
jgi:hypothetical protein